MADELPLEAPPIEDIDPADFGPDDPDDYIIQTPDERPFTVLLYDPDSAFAGGRALEATALVIVHATTPDNAGATAIGAVQRAANGATWRYPEILFLTEGYHEDLGPGSRRRVR